MDLSHNAEWIGATATKEVYFTRAEDLSVRLSTRRILNDYA